MLGAACCCGETLQKCDLKQIFEVELSTDSLFSINTTQSLNIGEYEKRAKISFLSSFEIEDVYKFDSPFSISKLWKSQCDQLKI